MTVIILRPIIVRNGLNEVFVQILKANDFLVIKRKQRKLTKQEAGYLCGIEKVNKANIEMFLDTVMDGPSEIIVVSKMGAVNDAITICSGSETGRRRSNQTGDSEGGIRTNMDSTSALFEISPFSSFNEFLDFEDFLGEHSRLQKYRKREPGEPEFRPIDALFVQKRAEIAMELGAF